MKIYIDKKLLNTCRVSGREAHSTMLEFPDPVNISYVSSQSGFVSIQMNVLELNIQKLIDDNVIAFIVNKSIVRTTATHLYISLIDKSPVFPVITVSVTKCDDTEYIRLEEAVR